MSNYYLCDYCDRNLRDCSACSCVCRIAGEEIVKAVVSDGDHALDSCLWFRPRSKAQAAFARPAADAVGENEESCVT